MSNGVSSIYSMANSGPAKRVRAARKTRAGKKIRQQMIADSFKRDNNGTTVSPFYKTYLRTHPSETTV